MYPTRGLNGLGLNTAFSTASSASASAFSNPTIQGLIATTGPAAPFIEAGLVATQLLSPLTSVFHVRAGANEADKIVPVQNELIGPNGGFDQVDRIVQTSTSIPQLQDVYKTVQGWIRDYLGFITSDNFRDGRASQQSANTVMPLLNGTGHYQWPTMEGQVVSVDAWGNPTDGGLLGKLSRRIMALSGTPTVPQITQGAGGMGATLVPQTAGVSYIPQAGYLPPVSPLSQIQTASVLPVSGSSPMLLLLLFGGLLVASRTGGR